MAMDSIFTILPFNVLRLSCGNRLVAPFYHTVSDRPLPHIRHLYPVKSVRDFESDLDFLLKHYEPVDFHALPECLNGHWNKPKPPLLLSFDDGLREFADPIAPVLLRKGVPALCFLNSAFLDNNALFFRYKASLLIEATQAPASGRNLLHYLHEKRLMPPRTSGLKQYLLSVKYHNQSVLDELAAIAGLDFSAFLARERPYLDSTQVENLIGQGFHFGAHSVDHPEYRYLPLEEQLRQTVASVEQVCNRFGLGYRLFSFPFTDFGVKADFFRFVLDEKKIVSFTFGCAGLKTDQFPNHIQRIPMERHELSARAVMSREILYYWLKLPFGKNHIRRR